MKPLIKDKDLLEEEELKLHLDRYFPLFESKRDNRQFLNGPDVTDFYAPPEDVKGAMTDIEVVVRDMDPAFRVRTDWEDSGENIT